MERTDQASISRSDSFLKALELSNDRLIAVGLLILCIVTRIISIPASLWEWDDILFAQALHKYDLAVHSPHPPGFPVFVAMARVAYWLIGDEHRALTIVAFIFASLTAPALFYFYNAVFKDRRIAFAGALLGSFAPNVWVQGGAGRSDGVAFTLGIIGLTLIIHGFQSQRSLIAGCAVFGLVMGIRTTALPVMGPAIAMVFIARLWRREWRVVVASITVGTVCLLVWIVPLIYHVTWPVYRFVMNNHSQYIFQIDTIFSPSQTSWLANFYRFRRFIVHIWGAKWIMESIYAFSAFGLFALALKRQWKTIGIMAIAFLPYMIFTYVLNAPLGGPLYSLPYIPFFTGLAACGLILIPGLLFKPGRFGVLKHSGLILAICLSITIAGWAFPIINLLHHEVSPPVRAFDYLKNKLDSERDLLIYDIQFTPYVSFYLPNQRVIQRDLNLDPQANLIWSISDHPQIISLTGDPILGMEGEHFIWKSSELAARRMYKLSLERFFGAHITTLSVPPGVIFLSGWYGIDVNQKEIFRWMQTTGSVALQNLAESMILRLRGSILDAPNADEQPTLIFRLNGTEIDRLTISGSEIDHQLMIKPNPSLKWSILSLDIDRTITPRRGADKNTHKVGLKCFDLDWTPVPGAPSIKSSTDQHFGAGWYPLENDKHNYWRWMGGSSVTHLPAIEGEGRLDLKMVVSQGLKEADRELTVEVAGTLLERFQPPQGEFTKTYYLPQSLHRGAKQDLKLALNIADSKSYLIKVYYLVWRPSANN